jgi:hypothetical protein
MVTKWAALAKERLRSLSHHDIKPAERAISTLTTVLICPYIFGESFRAVPVYLGGSNCCYLVGVDPLHRGRCVRRPAEGVLVKACWSKAQAMLTYLSSPAEPKFTA